jgi:uncharacterized membrane protein
LSIFSFKSGARSLFNPADEERIVAAIRAAEKRTSGEIRVFIESKCRFVDPVDRAAEVFFGLKMEQTEDRNGVILYVAMKHHQLAIFGDEGIHKIVGTEFWNAEVQKILREFNAEHYVDGIIAIVNDIGEALIKHFPYEQEDKNELPDNIVFGQ